MILEGPVQVAVCRDGNAVHARLSGPLNRDTTPHVGARLRELAGDFLPILVLDLGAVEYLDSDGIRWLHRLQEDLSEREVELRLAVLEGSRAERPLKLLKLDGVFCIERYPAESVEARSAALC